MEYKIRRSLTNNSSIERRRAIFLVGVVCLLVFFMTTFASALTWDNVAYYKLDEIVGTDVENSTGTYNGTNYNADIGITGKIGTAYNFSDTSYSYIALGDWGEGTPGANFTVSAWINPTTLTNYATVLSRTDSARSDGNPPLILAIHVDETLAAARDGGWTYSTP